MGSWVLLSLLAAFVWAIVNVIDKVTVTSLVTSPLVALVFLGIIGLVAALGFFAVNGFTAVSYTEALLLFAGAFCYVMMTLLYFYAAKMEEISRVVPLFYLSPIFILIMAAIFLGEHFQAYQYFGILAVVGGAFLLSVEKSFEVRSYKASSLMIVSALCLAVNEVIIKHILGSHPYWLVFAWVRLFSFVILLPVVFFVTGELKATWRLSGRRGAAIITVNEALNLAANFLLITATSLGFVTLTNALASVQPLFVLLLTYLLTKMGRTIIAEDISGKAVLSKLSAIVLIVLGALLVSS